jgi:hypothetical protein
MRKVRHLSRWEVAIATVASVKMGAGILVATISTVLLVSPPAGRYLLMLAHVIAFGAAGLVLVRYGSRDRRARSLGLVFVLCGSAFVEPLIAPLASVTPQVHEVLSRLTSVRVDAFVPYFVWQFCLAFSLRSIHEPVPNWMRVALRGSLFVGLALLGASVVGLTLSVALPGTRTIGGIKLEWLRELDATLYWPLLLSMLLPATVVLLHRANRRPAEEQRRVTWLVAGLFVGTVPLALWIVLTSLSATIARMLDLQWTGWILYPTFLSTPITTAYAVLVQRALDVRVVIRRALQYALTRYSTIAIASLPAVLLLVLLYRRRTDTIRDALASRDAVVLLTLAFGGAALLRGRAGLLARIDTLHFRAQYSPTQVLSHLVEQCRSARDPKELSQALGEGIIRAFHPMALEIVLLNDEDATIASLDSGRPLAVSSALLQVAKSTSGVLEVDFEDPRSPLHQLPARDVNWLLDGGFKLLLPLRNTGGLLTALVAIGEKKSELPFSQEDRDLISAFAAAAEMGSVLHTQRVSPHSGSNDDLEPPAAECPDCRAVHRPADAVCERCGAATVPCLLPHVIGGKFLVDQRIGAGGMGVVYRGLDVQLGRMVAIKTLPHLSPAESLRLRREARAIATVAHPHLAMIYGSESWRGQPLLVFEYLRGGTLEDREARGALSLRETLEIGLSLSSVLAAIHQAGVLHRDIKPSNIGFTQNGTPKLLDFGLARVLTAARPAMMQGKNSERRILGNAPETLRWTDTVSESTVDGTPLYMSPEARMGDAPGPCFDLWSLAMVLFEAIAGQHPLHRPHAVVWPGLSIPDIRELRPDAPAPVADFFKAALAEQLADRPQSASELEQCLRGLIDTLGTSSGPAAFASRAYVRAELPQKP